MQATNLQVENLIAPLGIDVENPRLTWVCQGGTKQTAYQVVCKNGNEVLWDSGKVDSSSMNCLLPIPYFSRLNVAVYLCVWDENGVQGEESKTYLEYGLLNKEDWQAK